MSPLDDITNGPRSGPRSSSTSRHAHRTAFAHLDLGFSLYESGNLMSRSPTEAELQLLYNHFPGTFKISSGPIGITLHVNPLPPRPHPVTVADVPLFITDETDHDGYAGVMGRLTGGPNILNHLDIRNTFNIPEDALDAIYSYCRQEGIPLRSIASYFGDLLVCTIETNYTGPLPRKIGKRSCTWKVYQGEESLANVRPSGEA